MVLCFVAGNLVLEVQYMIISPASIYRLCITRDSIEASRRSVFPQKRCPSKGQLAVIVFSPPENQNDDEEKTHSSSNNKKCYGNRSKFTCLACLSKEGLHAVTRGRAAIRTESVIGTLDWINIRTRAVVVFRAKVTVLLTPVDLIEATVANLTHGLMGGLVHSWATGRTFFGSNL